MDSCYQSTKLTLIKLVKGLNSRGNVSQHLFVIICLIKVEILININLLKGLLHVNVSVLLQTSPHMTSDQTYPRCLL